MTKQEFLQGLQASLEGEVSTAVIQENLRYYNEYIDSEVGAGSVETDVIAEIGDPRLIAKTIIDTTPGDGRGEPQSETYQGYSDGSQQGSFNEKRKGNVHYFDLNKWYVKLAVIVIAVMIFWLLIAVISGVLSLLIPLFPAIIVGVVLYWFIRGMRR